MTANILVRDFVRHVRRTKVQEVIGLDIDGTLVEPAGGRLDPAPPDESVGPILRSLDDAGYLIIGVTGSGYRRVRTLENQFEPHGKFKFPAIYTSYGGRLIRRNEHTRSEEEVFLGSRRELDALSRITSRMNDIREDYRAEQTDQGACYAMHLLAQACEESFHAACKEVQSLLAEKKLLSLLQVRATFHDYGIVVVPASMGKDLVARHILRQGRRKFVVCAGDTLADLPLLQKAKFPIVTRTQSGVCIPPELLAIVERKGMGYVASEEEGHGHGLVSGIKAAIEAGILFI